VVGRCDKVFNYALEEKRNEALAILEAKIYHTADRENYHIHNNSICIQMFTSLIGSGAPVGILYANGLAKFFWKEIINDKVHVFTYPENNSMADLDDEAQRLLFTQVMFHIVRCSVRIDTAKRARHSETVSAAEWAGKRMKADESHQGEAPERTETRNAERYGRESRHGKKRSYEEWEAVDGRIYKFKAYDFSNWSPQQMQNLQDDLDEEDKIRNSETEIDLPRAKKASLKH
jgi:hypothetical protein